MQTDDPPHTMHTGDELQDFQIPGGDKVKVPSSAIPALVAIQKWCAEQAEKTTDFIIPGGPTFHIPHSAVEALTALQAWFQEQMMAMQAQVTSLQALANQKVAEAHAAEQQCAHKIQTFKTQIAKFEKRLGKR